MEPLITPEQFQQLLRNGSNNAFRQANKLDTLDYWPVVKIFAPWGSATWLLSELDPAEPDIAFGLCDLGMGEPEMGSVRLSELESISIHGLTLERDLYFTAKMTITEYWKKARELGHIQT